MAAGAEELNASVNEIKKLIDNAKIISEKAFEQSQKTSETMSGLSQAAEKIGEILVLINSISSRTNLLSLNAAIEAARAGEAGLGFSIVASEIQSLSDQTSNATKGIKEQIHAVQNSTNLSVGEIKNIGTTLQSLLEFSLSIATAIEQQSAVTEEMANSMSSAAENVETINANLLEISGGAKKIEEMTTTLKKVSDELTAK